MIYLFKILPLVTPSQGFQVNCNISPQNITTIRENFLQQFMYYAAKASKFKDRPIVDALSRVTLEIVANHDALFSRLTLLFSLADATR
jgi:hypothetical protein